MPARARVGRGALRGRRRAGFVPAHRVRRLPQTTRRRRRRGHRRDAVRARRGPRRHLWGMPKVFKRRVGRRGGPGGVRRIVHAGVRRGSQPGV